MRIRVVAVGTRMTSWVSDGVYEYHKRLPRDFTVDWLEIPPAKRSGEQPEALKAKEAAAITRQLKADNRLVALDVAGEIISTEKLASRFQQWQMEPQPLTIIIGGPDGLSDGLLSQADQCWSLGRITLPHPLVRVILAEQLYRAWSINANHPYHRA